jgi:hypothetical protein
MTKDNDYSGDPLERMPRAATGNQARDGWLIKNDRYGSAHDTLPSQPARTITSPSASTPRGPRALIATTTRCSGGARAPAQERGFSTETVNSPSRISSALEARDFDILLMDLTTRDTTSEKRAWSF